MNPTSAMEEASSLISTFNYKLGLKILQAYLELGNLTQANVNVAMGEYIKSMDFGTYANIPSPYANFPQNFGNNKYSLKERGIMYLASKVLEPNFDISNFRKTCESLKGDPPFCVKQDDRLKGYFEKLH